MRRLTDSRRDILKALCLLTLGFVAVQFAADLLAEGGTSDRPNFLFIMADDLCTALGGYRHPFCRTPNLDRLASRGVLFENAYCQFPACGPSRASLMCGQYPAAIKALGNRSSNFRRIFPKIVTLPQFLSKQGYYTARVSKIFHMAVPGDIVRGTTDFDDPQSWDEAINIKAPEHEATGTREDLSPLVDHEGSDFVKVEADGDDLVHADGKAAREAIRLLGEIKDKPFFLAVGMVRPHVPLVAPRPYFEPYPARKMQLAAVPEGDLDDVPEKAKLMSNTRMFGMDREQQQKTLAAYYASVSYMDAQVGKVLDELKRLNLHEKTVVVFASDHGYNLGEHDCWQKVSLWEDSVRSPLIIAVPGSFSREAHGRRTDRIVELVDLYPTIVDLSGAKVPSVLSGKSLRPLLDDPDTDKWEKKPAYTISPLQGESLRTERWRFNLWNHGRDGVELYDHENDPSEFNNLARDPTYKATVSMLRQLMEEARSRAVVNEHL